MDQTILDVTPRPEDEDARSKTLRSLDQTQADAASSVAGPAPAAPPTPAAVGSDRARFGRFELTRLLGRGGMGEVHLATDTELDRPVAVKLLTHDDPEEVERFVREAHTAARLRHPAIVAIHDAGREPRPYIVMDYIDGTPLSDLRLPPRRAIEAIRDAARAVHYANGEGVVHRDLKPSNLMIDRQGRITVMDFGLARSVRDKELTVAGRIMGTPSYMSPEQADGLPNVDGRTDVYGLGATLYALLTGKPPAQGETMYAMVWSVLQQEPIPPRKLNPAVPAEVETVVLKCLEKDPQRRYDSAAELADDLERWLQGDPILARPASGLYRLQKRVRKNPRLYGVGALGLAAVALTAAILVPKWQGAQRRYEAEREAALSMMRRTAAVTLKAALAMRRHADLAAMEQFVPELEEACRQAQERAPELGEPHYHRGRMYRALMRFDEALAQQEEAVARDGGHALARYERGLLLLRRHETRVGEARRGWWSKRGHELAALGGGQVQAGAALQEPSRAELEDDGARALRGRAEEDLRAVAARAAEVGEGPGLCGAGLLALAGGRWAEAEETLARAVVADPSLEEAHEGLGKLALAQGRAADAIRRWSEALERDRGWVPHWLGRSAAWLAQGEARAGAGQDPASEFAAAVADAEQAAKLRPAHAEAWLARGRPRVNWAAWQQGSGQDPVPMHEAAVEDFGAALERDPALDEAWLRRGAAFGNLAAYHQQRGADPAEWYRRSIADLDEAERRNPQREEIFMIRGLTRGNWAEHAFLTGGDADTLFRGALDDFGKALAHNPAWWEIWLSRGVLHANWARMTSHRGQDPAERFRAAIEDYGQALRLAPENDETWMRRANARLNWAVHVQNRGEDPEAIYQEALADLGEALKRNPKRAESWERRAIVAQNRGVVLAGRGQDPGESYAAALADYARALEINPERIDTWTYRAMAHELWAKWKQRQGQDPRAEFVAAGADLAEALRRNPDRPETWARRGQVLVSAANGLGARDPQAESLYREAVEDYGKALAMRPNATDVLRQRAIAQGNWGNLYARRNEDPAEHYDAAAADYGAVIERNPGDADAWIGRGNVRASLATFRASHGVNADELYRDAIADFEKAVGTNPRSAETLFLRGNAWTNWGQQRIGRGEEARDLFERGTEDLERSLEINAANEEGWRRLGHARMLLAQCLEAGRAREVLEQAHAALDRALGISTRHPDSYRYRGMVRRLQQRFDEAIADFQEALRLYPGLEAKLRPLIEDCEERKGGE